MSLARAGERKSVQEEEKLLGVLFGNDLGGCLGGFRPSVLQTRQLIQFTMEGSEINLAAPRFILTFRLRDRFAWARFGHLRRSLHLY